MIRAWNTSVVPPNLQKPDIDAPQFFRLKILIGWAG